MPKTHFGPHLEVGYGKWALARQNRHFGALGDRYRLVSEQKQAHSNYGKSVFFFVDMKSDKCKFLDCLWKGDFLICSVRVVDSSWF